MRGKFVPRRLLARPSGRLVASCVACCACRCRLVKSGEHPPQVLDDLLVRGLGTPRDEASPLRWCHTGVASQADDSPRSSGVFLHAPEFGARRRKSKLVTLLPAHHAAGFGLDPSSSSAINNPPGFDCSHSSGLAKVDDTLPTRMSSAALPVVNADC